jgi:hypothetical protein
MVQGGRDWGSHIVQDGTSPDWRLASGPAHAPLLAKHAFRFASEVWRARVFHDPVLEPTALKYVDRAARLDGLVASRSFEIESEDFHAMDDQAFMRLLEGREVDSAESTVG